MVCTYYIGGWVVPRAGLSVTLKKQILTPAGNRTPTPRRPAHSLAILFLINKLYIILKLCVLALVIN
jgi:hypothetical protein